MFFPKRLPPTYQWLINLLCPFSSFSSLHLCLVSSRLVLSSRVVQGERTVVVYCFSCLDSLVPRHSIDQLPCRYPRHTLALTMR